MEDSVISLVRGNSISVTGCLNNTNSSVVVNVTGTTDQNGQLVLATSDSSCISEFSNFSVVTSDECVKVTSTRQEVYVPKPKKKPKKKMQTKCNTVIFRISGTLIGSFSTENSCGNSGLSLWMIIVIVVVSAFVLCLVITIIVIVKVPRLREKFLPYRDDRPEDTVAMAIRKETESLHSRRLNESMNSRPETTDNRSTP